MEYVVGSVAALVSGNNTTPSRPRGLKRAATPVKHQHSPNITPKSELVNDRSIFLSPTTQKKKAIVKKSPKRIFQITDLVVTDEKENLVSPKADKVKKYLTDELGGEGTPLKVKKLKSQSSDSQVPPEAVPNEITRPKKSKKRKVSDSEPAENIEELPATGPYPQINEEAVNKEFKKKNKKLKKNNDESKVIKQIKSDTAIDNIEIQESEENTNLTLSAKKIKKSKSKLLKGNEIESADNMQITRKKNKNKLEKDNIRLDVKEGKKKKRNLKKSKTKVPSLDNPSKKITVNPNAITGKDTDSEHESDNEIASDNDEKINEVLKNDKSASEDEEDEAKGNNLKPKKKLLKEPVDTEEGENVVHDPDEVNRTLFVGNVPFSKKCKKEIKKIFSIYGEIETVRIRSIAVADPRLTPRLAAIRGELHPERPTVNVYVKYKRPDSVQQALVENGRELSEGRHARVSACGAPALGEHDAARAVFAGNVPLACADDELRALFEPCGAVRSVRLVRDSTGLGKGFGYVNFESKDSVELALALTPEQRTLRNRELRVKRCTLSHRNQDKQGGIRGRGQSGIRGNGHRGSRGHSQSGMRGHGQGGMRGHSQSGMWGHGQGGMRGHSQSGMRGHGQGGMRGHSHSGMRGHGQDGMRGHSHSGMRGHGQGGMRGRGNMRGSTRGHEGTRTDGQGHDQGAFRRLEHKKKKSGGGEFVGLTPDSKTKPKTKLSSKKKALAEIMSKQ